MYALRKRISDYSLRPLYAAVRSLVPSGACVLDVGFGSGSLLLSLAPRIARGVGLEEDETLVECAKRRAGMHAVTNVEFHRGRFALLGDEHFNAGILSLVLHSIETHQARDVLRMTADRCEEVIIADYALHPGLATHVDEWVFCHYGNFRAYLRKGGAPALIRESGLSVQRVQAPHRMGIGLWLCRKDR